MTAPVQETCDRDRWLLSSVGQAYTAYQRGDFVFQAALGLAEQSAEVVAMVGASSPIRHISPNQILNEICAQGWEPVSATAVFIPSGEVSRDKFFSSGQQVAVAGTVVCYYLFRRVERRVDVARPAI